MIHRSIRTHLLLIAGLLAISMAGPALAIHEDPGDRHVFDNPYFQARWERTDLPVSRDTVDRTYIWGPEPLTPGMTEPYVDASGGERTVQYWDKARMELANPDASVDDLWAVTNGLLVVEMVEGQVQVGDDTFESAEPAEVPIAGDLDGQTGPTYADINRYGLRGMPPVPEGTLLTSTLADDGEPNQDERFADYGVTAAFEVSVPGINHTVASPFWEFMNSSGPITEDALPTTGQLFPNPFYATGYPITEAFWTTVPVGEVDHDVLWQCFERRCLTYTPDNPDGFKVEAGNVGLHYHQWRYQGQQPPSEATAEIYLVDVGDSGENGILIGCDDSLVPQTVEIPADHDIGITLASTLDALFAVGDDHDPDLYNGLANSSLSVDSATVENGVATVHVSGDVSIGGVCDEPRFIQQIRYTALQFDAIVAVNVFVNGEYLNGMFDARGDAPELTGGVLATFDVSGEVFQVWVTNPDTIDQLFALQAGESQANIPNGPILEGAGVANHNMPWSWHLDPEQTEMAEVTIEVCDGAPSFVEENVDEFVNNVGQYCPWSAELLHLTDLR